MGVQSNYNSDSRKVFLTFQVPIYIFTIKGLKKSVEDDIDCEKVPIRNPNLFEKLLGYLSISIFFVHCVYKAFTGQMIFMVNPCHVINVRTGVLTH
jgi:hypothetical protein